MKKTSKHKNVAKTNHKISDFFTKAQKPAQVLNGDDKANSLIIDSDDDFVIDTPSSSKNKYSKDKENRKRITNKKLKNFPDPAVKKRRVQEVNINSPPSTITIEDSPIKIMPSRSECESQITTKTIKQIVSVKSPEKLLTPEALKEYLTPEKHLKDSRDKVTPSPRRIVCNDSELSESIENVSEVDTSSHKRIYKKSTPKKPITPDKSQFNLDQEVKTPLKEKKTPKKLFEKSPNNLNNFNIHVIDSFVKLTPSKSNVEKSTNNDIIFVKSTEKKQSSILKYMSPSPSPRSLQAQNRNEATPTKRDCQASTSTSVSVSKVKTKLRFSPTKTEQTKIVQESLNNGSTLNDLGETSTGTSEVINESSYNFDDSWDKDLREVIPEYNLDLTESQHCKIVAINPFSTKSVLTLKSTKTGEQAICNLEGFWIHSMLSIGDTVHVCAKKLNEIEWLINNDHGLLVYEPDLLISTTSVVNSLWCKRRSVLQERFRGFEPANEAMLIGTLVHSLIQFILKTKMNKREDIEALIKKLILERNVIRSLYETSLTIEHIEAQLMKFVSNIQDFTSLYLEECKRTFNVTHKKDDWTGKIKIIEDIEENIWSPELGLKGKVDVSIKTTDFNTMPLEIKTGRASVSLEHKGQVMMYVMMMNKLGYNVSSGLLLYIREGVLREIPATEKERRHLMLLRNELAYYLMREPKIVYEDETDTQKMFPPELPEPINHPSCQKCPYNVICTSYAKYNDENISTNKILKGIQDEVLQSLSDTHLNYFMKWISLLAMEANSDKKSKKLWDIFTLTPQKREMNGRSIINLKVLDVGEEMNGVFEHIFEKMSDGTTVNLYANGIMEGNYVVVSTDTRPAVASGFVTDIKVTSISVTLDRNLNKKYVGGTFHIDTYDSSSISSFNLTSLSLLLEVSPRANELRKIIIDKSPPSFRKTLPKIIATKGKAILKRLNVVQQRAVLRAIASEDYFLIKGMPGTGKTSTIVALIQLLYELNKNILITSHTHSAVDNVCIKLLQHNIKVLRLGSESRIDPKLQEYTEHKRTRHCKTPEELQKVYDAQVVAVTCLGSGHPLLTKRIFDICIVDESTQVIQSSVIRPLHSARTFILIGDQDQLPPVVKDKRAIQMGMSESLFERLYTKECSVALNLNYRMNSFITSVANEVTYNKELQVGSDDVGKATINIPNKAVVSGLNEEFHWLFQVFDDSLEKSVQVLDTGPVWNMSHTVPWKINTNIEDETKDESYKNLNIYEAAVVVKIVRTLLQAGVSPHDIAVLVTYRVQGAQISNLLKADNVNVSTVDQFQGKDRNIIIYSCAKSKEPTNFNNVKFELLEDKRRLTVAITRAKHKLLIIGDVTTLQNYSTFAKLIPFLKNNTIRLVECNGFKWESVLDI